MRACIGRAFAWQEGHLAVAMILQNFNLEAVDPSYVMKLRQTLTIKPINFRFRASLRNPLDAMALERKLWGGDRPLEVDTKKQAAKEVRITFVDAALPRPLD